MQPPKIIEKEFIFKKWNLAEAELAIEFVLTRNKSALESEQIIFLEKMKDWIHAFTELLRDNQTSAWDNLINSPEIYTLETRTTIYRTQLSQTVELINAALPKLLAQFNWAYYACKNQNEPYALLLKNLMYCCFGVKKSTVEIQTILEDNPQSLILKSHQSADEMGAIVFPMQQSNDPLIGADLDADQEKSWIISGYCYGHVLEWGQQIVTQGYADPLQLLNVESHRLHKQQLINPASTFVSVLSLKNPSQFVKELLNIMSNTNVYHLNLFGGYGDGHALGIRKIPHTSTIELYDPDQGIFLFPNEKDFMNFFTRILVSYCLQEGYLEVSLNLIGKQPEHAKSYLPMKECPNTYEVTASKMQAWVNAFNLYYIDIINKNKETAHDFMNRLFLDVLPSYLEYVKSPDEIPKIKEELAKLTFLFDGKKSFWGNLFSEKSNDPWQTSNATREVAKMLTKKQAELSTKPVKEL